MGKISKIDSKRYDYIMGILEKKRPEKAKKIKAEKAKKEKAEKKDRK